MSGASGAAIGGRAGCGRVPALVLVALFLVTSLGAFSFFKLNLGANPTLKHDDYEYTYPSFNLARHGEFGSPYYGNPLNVAHRTYDLTVYYYAPVHAALIRVFGDDVTSIPLANTLHFALMGALGLVYFVARRQWLMGVFFAAALWTDPMALEIYRTGRPEVTCGFGILVATLAIWDRWAEHNRARAVLSIAAAGGVAAACSHSAGVFVGIPLFLFLIATNLRALLTTLDGVALVVPFLSVPALFAYFTVTDSWQHIAAQMATNTYNVSNPARIMYWLPEQFAGVVSAYRTTNLWLLVPGVALAVGLRVASRRRPELWTAAIAQAVRGLVFFGVAFVAGFWMQCVFMKPLHSYSLIYKSLYFLSLASALTIVVRALQLVVPAPLRRGVVAAALLLVSWHVYDSLFLGARLRWMRPGADYRAFGRELTTHLRMAGVAPTDTVYTPGPFASSVARDVNVLAHPAEKYYWSGIPASFHKAAAALTVAEGVKESRASYVRDLLCLDPQWVVRWEDDESYLDTFGEFLDTFPNGDPRMQIRLADSYESSTTYTGRIWIYRVTTDRAYAASLERGACVPPRK